MILTCRQFVEKVTDAREGRLSRMDRMGYSAHLAWCRHCRVYVGQMEQTIEALRGQEEQGRAPAEVREAVLARLRAGRRQ